MQARNASESLLKPATVEQSAAKVGIFGPQGSGKTTTAAMIALGLSITYHNRAPVAFMDTENGSDYLVELFAAEGVPLLNFKSRAFTDMKAELRNAASKGCCAYLVDSYTHPWAEVQDSLRKILGVKRLEFQHQDQLKTLWREWTDLMLNSPLHVIVSGRLGYVWDKEEDKNGRKEGGELIKLGTKMKSESEAGYEPSLLIEMEGLQDSALRNRKSRTKKGTITHYAYILKDRWRTLNGRTFQWPDLNDYKVGDYKAVFDPFLPHFSKLVIGQKQTAVNGARTSNELFNGSGDSDYHRRVKQVQIAIEEIEGTIRKLWSGQDAQSKIMRQITIETLFHTRSWTAVTSRSLEDLELALDALAIFESQVTDGGDGEGLVDETIAQRILEAAMTRVAGQLAASGEQVMLSAVPV